MFLAGAIHPTETYKMQPDANPALKVDTNFLIICVNLGWAVSYLSILPWAYLLSYDHGFNIRPKTDRFFSRM